MNFSTDTSDFSICNACKNIKKRKTFRALKFSNERHHKIYWVTLMNYKTPVKSAFRYKIKSFRETTFQHGDVWALKVVLVLNNFRWLLAQRQQQEERNWIGKIMVIMWLRIYCSRYSFFIPRFREEEWEKKKSCKVSRRVIYVFVIHFCELHVN